MTSKILRGWLTRASLVIMLFALVGGVLGCNSSSPSEDSAPQEVDKAPDFTLPTMAGDEITLSELEGAPVVLNFWATSCPHCVKELHYFEAVAQQSEGEIKIVAVDVGESASRVQEFFGDYEPSMIVALDTRGEVFSNYSSKYNPRGFIPITFFVGSEGVIQYTKLGAFANEMELWDNLRSLF